MKKKLQKIRLNFVEKALESFSFFMPKEFSTQNNWAFVKYNNWSFLDSYMYIKNFKFILSYLKLLSKDNKKFLFILEDDIFDFFKNSDLKKTHFFAKSHKTGLMFLQQSAYLKEISAIIYIGSFNKISLFPYSQFNLPIFFITDSAKIDVDYIQYNSLDFHSAIFFLRIILESVLTKLNKDVTI